MNRGMHLVLPIVLLFAASPAFSGDYVESETGIAFSDSFKAGDKKLSVAGGGCREKMWVNVYAATLYVDPAAAKDKLSKYKGKSADDLAGSEDFYKDLIATDFAKAIVIKMARDVDAASMKTALKDALALSMKMDDQAEKFMNQLDKDLKTGDEVAFVFLPGNESRMIVAGKEGAPAKSKTLSESIQKIWLGEETVSAHIKTNAVQLVPDLIK